MSDTTTYSNTSNKKTDESVQHNKETQSKKTKMKNQLFSSYLANFGLDNNVLLSKVKHLAQRSERMKPEYMKNLEHYENGGEDKSIVAHIFLKPYVYEKIIQYIPKWVAPNLITTCGFACVWLTVLLCYLFSPDMSNDQIPRLVFLVIGLLVFAYQTLDGLDGNQARRTKQSSPLGDLFDHGVDSMVATLLAIPWMVLCANGPSFFTFMMILSGWIPFFFATWEEYYVGGLFLGYINGPIEGLLTLQAGFIITGLFGHNFWNRTLKQFSYKLSAYYVPFLANVKVSTLLSCGVLLGGIGYASLSVMNVYSTIERKKEEEEGKNKRDAADPKSSEMDFQKALTKLSSFFIISLCSCLWVLISKEDIMKSHPYLLILSLGFSMGYLVSSTTLSHVMKAPLRTVSVRAIFPVVACLFNALLHRVPYIGSNIAFMGETTSLILFFLFALINYVYYVLTVSLTISDYLGIGILTVKNEGKKSHGQVSKESSRSSSQS